MPHPHDVFCPTAAAVLAECPHETWQFLRRENAGWIECCTACGHERFVPCSVQAATVFWQDASKTLPDDDLTVLMALECGEVWTGFHDAGDWRYVSAELVGERVLYWAEFPEPPAAKGGGK